MICFDPEEHLLGFKVQKKSTLLSVRSFIFFSVSGGILRLALRRVTIKRNSQKYGR